MDINKIIEQHALWLDTNGEEGTRANLTDANLSHVDLTGVNLTDAELDVAILYNTNLTDANLTNAGMFHTNLTRANLTRANLSGANIMGVWGDSKHLKSVFCETYPVTYTAKVMQIAWECHKIEDWWKFDDARIVEMYGKEELKWWKNWKPILQQIITTSPAIATG